MLTEQSAVEIPIWSPRATLALLLSYFGLFGVTVGAHGVLWAEVIRALGLSKTTFGAVQLAGPLLSVVLLLATGPIERRLGKKRMAFAGLALMAATQFAIAQARGLPLLIVALLLSGAGYALLETAMNSATLDWEHATGRHVMNSMHAGFSAGAVIGAFGAGALLELRWSYAAVLMLLMALAIASLASTLPVDYPPAEASPPGDETHGLASLRLLALRPGLLGLAFLSLLGIVGESVANLWSVIYLRELGAEAFLGGAAFALFNGSMLVGRLFNAPLVSRYGSRASLLLSGVGVALAAALLLAPGGVALAVAAFVLLGLAVAGVVPTVLTAAARLVPGHNGAITGAIMAFAYTGFIIIPPLTGWLADAFSLQVALVSVGLSGLGILLLARNVR